MKIIKSSFLLRLYDALVNLAINHSRRMLTIRPTIKIRMTITQNTYEWVIGLSGSSSYHSIYHTIIPMMRNINPSLMLATNRKVVLNSISFTLKLIDPREIG
jgi:hypothetical protein